MFTKLMREIFIKPRSVRVGITNAVCLWTMLLSIAGSALLLLLVTGAVQGSTLGVATGIPIFWVLTLPVVAFGGWINYQLQKENSD